MSARFGYAQFAVLYRRALLARSRDITDGSARRRTLVLAPHPDDETVGCGATLARKRHEGSDVHVCIVTDGGRSERSATLGSAELAKRRAQEARAACAALGIGDDRIQFLNRGDGTLTGTDEELVDQVAAVIREARPQELLVPCTIDVHPDHRAVYHIGVEAHARAGSDAIVLAYPIHFWRPSAWADSGASSRRRAVQRFTRPAGALGRLRTRVVRTGPFLDTKRRALAAYGDEFGAYTWISGDAFLAAYLTPEELFFEIDPTGPPTAPWQ